MTKHMHRTMSTINDAVFDSLLENSINNGLKANLDDAISSTGVRIPKNAGLWEYPDIIRKNLTLKGDTPITPDIAALIERISVLEQSVITGAKIIGENKNSIDLSVDDNTLLIIHDDKFDTNTDSIRSLTHRAIAAKFGDIENKITQIPKFNVAVVDELPINSISLTTIYLLRNTNTDKDNLFSEFIYVKDINNKFVWEKLGEQTIITDNVVTHEQLNSAIRNALQDYAKTINEIYASKSELNAKIEALRNEFNDAVGVSENDILLSIQSGMIGDNITITDAQIDKLTNN